MSNPDAINKSFSGEKNDLLISCIFSAYNSINILAEAPAPNRSNSDAESSIEQQLAKVSTKTSASEQNLNEEY